MPLVQVNIPSPKQLRGGWAAMSAYDAATGIHDSVFATQRQWFYDDGGGNWACIRFHGKSRAVLIGLVYGWDGEKWWRANYKIKDGFKEVGLLQSMKLLGCNSLGSRVLTDNFKWFDKPGKLISLRALIAADGQISEQMLEAVMPVNKVYNYANISDGVIAATQFLKVDFDV